MYDTHRRFFLAILACWLVVPIAMVNRLAEDAVPYVVAGELAPQHPDDVYTHDGTTAARFAERSCELNPECDKFGAEFVAPPVALPLGIVAAHAGGVLLFRLLSAVCLAVGMYELWRRLARRTPRAPMLLTLTALALTPFAVLPIGLGQTSPLLFVSACLGISGMRRRSWPVAGIWVLATAVKIFPAALVLVLVARRRWGLLLRAAALAAGLAVVTAALTAPSLWGDFLRALTDSTKDQVVRAGNSSLDALVTSRGLAVGIGVVVVAVVAWRLRRSSADLQWAVGLLVAMLPLPIVWWHYVWVGIGAIGVVLAERRALDDRTLAVLPLAALATVPASIANGTGGGLPLLQLTCLLAAVAACLALARPATPEPAPA